MATVTSFRASESLTQGEVTGIACGMATVTGPASYAVGGFAIDLKTDEGLVNDPFVVISSPGGSAAGVPTDTGGPPAVLDYYAYYDYSNKKLLVYDPADGSEVPATTNISTYTFYLFWMSSQAAS